MIGDSVLVIDAGGSRAEGEALYAAIRRETDLPISHLVLTHMHPDHILGSEVFSEAGATIVANAKLPPAVSMRSASWRQSIPAQIGTKALLGTRIAPVDQLVSAPLTLDLGRTKVTLTPVAAAHTDNDLTAFDSRSGAFFTGDLVFRELTPVIDGSLSGWESWLAEPPRDPAPSLIIPGHGAIQNDWKEAISPQKPIWTPCAAPSLR
ncbi:MBL fold metallo-hydrolase [Paracoccus cavernae]|uniref:MBL fold metallo-hydrolase n=1 Tax=Paracoccus cavernae TaxID=1571207 RepID=A0ABT8D7Q2_9RHOB|nr:MBL fold metallo-hydrolase [Paracoccus cavernae]